jgi:predicted nucleotidyltransferase
MERLLSELVEKLNKAHGERLISVVLYGSAATHEKDRFSDYNVLSVLQEVTPRELAEAEPVFRWWREMQNPAPLLLSELEVRTSTDCFPIEFTDIKARHEILHGTDVVAGIDIDYSFYRAQVEHELRAKLLRLRQKAGGVLSEKDLLLRMMADSVSTFCVLLRHALLLDGQPPRWERREVVNAAAQHFGLDPAPFLTLLAVRDGTAKPKDIQPQMLLEEYLKQVRVVVDKVDQMER